MIINHVRLVPEVSGGISTEDGYVEISGKTIEKVSSAPYDGNSAFYDAAGKTLIPGLFDLHTHIGMGQGNKGGFMPEGNDMFTLEAYCAQVGHYLDHGFTTVRDCGCPKRVTYYVRDMINRGIIEGPDVIACGPIISSSALDDGDAGDTVFADGPYEIRKAVHREMAAQADFIKIYASGSAGDPKGKPTHPIMFEDEIRSAVETAELHDSYVAAHCHADSAIRACINSGVHTIEHATYLSEDTIELLKEKRYTCLVPTLAACFVSQEEPKARAFWLARLTPMLECEGENIGKAYKAGIKIGFGTDCGSESKQYVNGIEFEYRKKYSGMSDKDLLIQATTVSAEIAFRDKVTGSVKAGLKADLVLADGNPDEDISCLYRKPIVVWKNGVQVR